GPTVEGLPASWDRAIASAAKRLGVFLKDPAQVGVVLSATCSNEDNYALARLAKEWKVGLVLVAGKPPVPARADGRLRVADVNPNAAGVKAIAAALGLATTPSFELDRAPPANLRALVVLGDVLPGFDAARLKELEVIAVASHERGVVTGARVALPIAAWAEAAGTVTNAKGRVQRMHAAFAPPGQAIAGWDAIARLGHATGVKLAWSHAREVWKDMVAQVAAWKDVTWAREVRPLALRFAGSRG
ncbi:MAG TPA: molybdopterin-dependent oxidoreductase, partial [Kofleriaceae bacterium]|nr:molybdopterin-dependent oxidoreductase [Kofleriaceae bacterium]